MVGSALNLEYKSVVPFTRCKVVRERGLSSGSVGLASGGYLGTRLLSSPPGHRAYTVGRTEELMEPPGGTHTTIDLYSKLSADPTIFAKLRIKSEKADA